jgi:hypothetical protein
MAPGALIDAAKICWHDKCQHAAEALDQVCSGLQLHWAEECGPPKVGTDWTQSLQKAVHGVQIALNIADVSAGRRTAAGATYGSTPHPASLVAVASQPEMDTQVGDMEGPQVAGSSVRTAVLDNLWLADLTQMQATYAQCPEGRPGWFPKCLLIQGDAQLNTWRCSHRTRLV